MSAWISLFARGDASELEALLDPDVHWQGLLPELTCSSRTDVLRLLTRFAGRAPRLTKIVAEEAGDRVEIYAEGLDLPENEVLAAGAPRGIVFTFRDGMVVRMESSRPPVWPS